MNTSITKEKFEQFIDYNKKIIDIDQLIREKITSILKAWTTICDLKFDQWYFSKELCYECGGEEASLFNSIQENIPDFGDCIVGINLYAVKEFDDNLHKKMQFIDKDGQEQTWRKYIPIKWLFDDSIIKEIEDGRVKWLKRNTKNIDKEKIKAAKDNHNKLIKSAKEKLSKEELEALKSTFK